MAQEMSYPPTTPPNTPVLRATRPPMMMVYNDALFEYHDFYFPYDSQNKNVWLHQFEVLIKQHPDLVRDPITGGVNDQAAIGLLVPFLQTHVNIGEAIKVDFNNVYRTQYHIFSGISGIWLQRKSSENIIRKSKSKR